MDLVDLKSYIREVSDFKSGVNFKDIGPLVNNPEAFRQAFNEMLARMFIAKGHKDFHKIAAIESRGFFFGPALALRLNAGFVPVRKKGKLPGPVVSVEYTLEYGTAALEIQRGSISKGEWVWIIDDILATGGTAAATAELVEMLGGTVAGFVFLAELLFLNGREKLGGRDVFSLVSFDA